MLQETAMQDNQSSKINSKQNSQGFLKGIPSSSGIAIGTALIIEPDPVVSDNNRISPDMVEAELERFNNMLTALNNDFNDVIANSNFLGPSALSIIETYQFLINDEYINNNIRNRITSGFNAESAVIREYESQKNLFRNAKDQILRDRTLDIDNVKNRMLSTLCHRTPDFNLGKDKILVVLTLSPTELVKYKEAGAIGVITEMGGIASHVSILARSFDMPAIIGVKDATKVISDSTELIIDGFTGLIIYNPDYALLKRYQKRIFEIEEHKKLLGELVNVKTETSDKKLIHLQANVDRLDDVKSALLSGAEGVGLVRSESLLLNSGKIPGEDIQYGWYREISDRMYPMPVTIRCFDVGSDKFSAGIPLHENNPALGLRGIRFLLYSRDVFTTQVKAILRASVNKNIRLMLPMISDISELMTAKKIISDCMLELDKKYIDYDSKIPIGIMVETPSAVLTSEILAKECNFFSIGTNDLTQYTLAADRTNDLVTDIYDSFHPSVLRLIAITIDNAVAAGIPVGICGELAGHSAATPLLIGMGISELSIPPTLLLELKNRILKTSFSDSEILAQHLLRLESSNAILKILESETNV